MIGSIAAPYVRWYFNRSDNPLKCWSVDFGPDSPEIVCGKVHFGSVVADSRFIPIDRREALTKDDPTAWLESYNVRLAIGGSVVTIEPQYAGPDSQPSDAREANVP